MKYLRRNSLLPLVVLLSCLLLRAPLADAAVEQRGVWPEEEAVSLTLSNVPRSEAVQRLAAEARWSLIQEGVDSEPVSLNVHAQPAAKVLSMLLADQEAVVDRDGALVSVRLNGARAPERVSNKNPHVVSPTKPDEDLFVPEQGHVGKEQVVRDVFVLGSVVIEGTVTGSVVVLGGEARLLKGAKVREEVIAFRGSLDIEDGVEIGGDVAALFGTLKRGAALPKDCVACVDEKKDPWQEFFGKFFGDLASAAIAWLLGAALIALIPGRVEVLRGEVVRRPWRSLGFGLLGVLGLVGTVATLVVTLIGIPLAVLLVVLTLVASYLAFCVVPLAVGRRVVGQRSQNPYIHQAVGCAMLFVVLSIPVAGGLFGFVATLVAFGALLTTRGGHAGPRAGAAELSSGS